MKRAILALLLLAAVEVMGCGSSGGSGTDLPPARPLPFIGYGLVNGWNRIDPEPLANALKVAGLGLTEIEWAPWNGEPDNSCQPGSSSRTYPIEAAQFVSAMRARGITTLINIINANGCAQWAQNDQYVKDAVNFIVTEIGTDGVILSGVSEPWARNEARALSWTQLVRDAWHGLFALPDRGQNHHLAQPYWDGIAYNYLDVHYCSDGELVAALANGDRGALHNTDCGLLINPGAARAALFAAAAAATDSTLIIYDFKGVTPDYGVIAAMGAAIK